MTLSFFINGMWPLMVVVVVVVIVVVVRVVVAAVMKLHTNYHKYISILK